MADERLERNWKMANAASDNVMRPASEQYRANYDEIFRSKCPTKQQPSDETLCEPK